MWWPVVSLRMRIVVLCKRQYTNRDVIDDRYGRLWEIPAELARAGHSVTCVSFSYARKDVVDEDIDVGGAAVRWVSVNLGRLLVFGLIRYLRTLQKILQATPPDVIWSASDSVYTVLGQSLARRYGCAHVADLYDNFESFAAYHLPFMGGKFRRSVVAADGVSCVSENLRRHVVQTYGRSRSTALITNAVDTAMFQPQDRMTCREQLGLPRDAILVGAAGDLSASRGADILFQSIAKHAEDLPGVHIAVAGFRDSKTRIPEAANIHDLGMLPFADVPVFVASLDIAVVYNRASAFGDYCFPQKFYEVLACGVPLVAANVGELGILLQQHPALLYEDGDTESFVRVLRAQLGRRQLLELQVPTWRDQALLLGEHMQAVLTGA